MAKSRVRFLVFAALGLLLGWGIRMVFLPPPVQWERLPASPSPVIALLNICEDGVYVKAADGATFQRTWENEQWSSGASDALCKGYPTITKPCDFSSQPFAANTHPPPGIRACLQGYTQYIEGYRRQAYVLDSGGNVWRWHLFHYGGVSGENDIGEFLLTTAPQFCCPAAGGLVALLPLLTRRPAAVSDVSMQKENTQRAV